VWAARTERDAAREEGGRLRRLVLERAGRISDSTGTGDAPDTAASTAGQRDAQAEAVAKAAQAGAQAQVASARAEAAALAEAATAAASTARQHVRVQVEVGRRRCTLD
jgi:hypothetical protein